MNAPLQDASLPTGEVVRVDAKTAFALNHLNMLAQRLVHGGIDVLFMVWDGPEPNGNEVHSLTYFNKHERLMPVSERLQNQSKKLAQMSTLWDGNAPGTNRSFASN